jgi:alpha-tubulin suppressor-like RCC1 family protein
MDQMTEPGVRRPLLFSAPLLAVLLLAALVFSASAHAAGASVMGWGENYYGQLGNGSTVKSGCFCEPSAVQMSGVSDATQVSGGASHSLVLHANGTVTAQGYNFYGQLGDGTSQESTAPVAVKNLTNVVEVDAGYEHSLALLADGTVMAWGENTYGELGVGASKIGGGGPEECGPFWVCSRVPVQVPGLSDVVAITADLRTSYALLADGTVMAWGYDRYGQLGDGQGVLTGCECVESPVQVPGVSGAMGISAGEDHVLALMSDGGVTGWGENAEGQVGNGSVIEAPPPACLCVVAVGVGGLPGPSTEVAAGGYHSIALLTDGVPHSWGENYYGQRGDGTNTYTGCECVPTPGAAALSGVESVAAGEAHTLAQLGDGSVRSWGYNGEGALGDGTEDNRNTPVVVGGVAGASEVSTGKNLSFALIGPTHALTVQLEGAGAGTVGGADGIICPAISCVARFPDSQVKSLRAEPAAGSGFAGFTGPCTGTALCRVRMNADQTVTATFGPPKGTKITKAKIKQGKKPKKKTKRKPKPKAKANFSFSAPGAVSGYQCMLIKPKPKRKKGKKRKRAKPRFTSCASPKRYKKLRKGRYTFKVRALNTLGADAKPAVRKFRIRR